MQDYFDDAKKRLEELIPDFESPEFKRMGEKIRKDLQRKEADLMLVKRTIKTLVLGDWNCKEKKERLMAIKNHLLSRGYYAQTIDYYYNLQTRGGLSQLSVFETCCINHQLIVFIDGEGAGTITEQNYLHENYVFQGKVLFFIEESKFSRFKDNPSEYLSMFPSIITYKEPELEQAIMTFVGFQVHRLAEIIMKQAKNGRGMHNPNYAPWKKRLKEKMGRR